MGRGGHLVMGSFPLTPSSVFNRGFRHYGISPGCRGSRGTDVTVNPLPMLLHSASCQPTADEFVGKARRESQRTIRGCSGRRQCHPPSFVVRTSENEGDDMPGVLASRGPR